ncbi:hypothetical protein LCGC14_3073820 [marine sediment metagenome]|uniref:Uncharacterized protein n=1 Tax=marine sediment metagenome TaxID=412755 RepID=A0A0F8X3R3_9ZZZZ
MTYTVSSSREAVLAQVGHRYVMVKEIAERVGVTMSTALTHLHAAAEEGLIERVEGLTLEGREAYFWRRRLA